MDKLDFEYALNNNDFKVVCDAVYEGYDTIDEDSFKKIIKDFCKAGSVNAKKLSLCLNTFPIFDTAAAINAFHPTKKFQSEYLKDFVGFRPVYENTTNQLNIVLDKIFDAEIIDPSLVVSTMSIGRYYEEMDVHFVKDHFSVEDAKVLSNVLDNRVKYDFIKTELNVHTGIFNDMCKGKFGDRRAYFAIYSKAGALETTGMDLNEIYARIKEEPELNVNKLERILMEVNYDRLDATLSPEQKEFVIDEEYLTAADIEMSKEPFAFTKQMYKLGAAERDLEKLWAKENDALYEPEKPKRKVGMRV